ncbi:HDOD domain-containing protein [Paraglaciecola sp. 25GB23A]|uniref:HDOD domain-containing protein n=1 Tax=Paraglaciecola sp. 25GB23A TaxID=3156068 RepID=UPI0032AEA76C
MPIDLLISLSLVLILLILLFTLWNKSPQKSRLSQTHSRSVASSASLKMASSAQQEANHQPSEDELARLNEFFEFQLFDAKNQQHKEDFLNDILTLRKPHPMLIPLSRNILEPKELFDIIKTDPQLVAKIITIVNSPLYGVRKPITNINHAIIFLGVVQVKNIATQFVLEKTVAFVSRRQELAYKRIWSACFLASSISLILAKELNFENAAEISTRCLLSYIGDISILAAKPELANIYLDNAALYNRVKQSQTLIGTNAAIVGSVLAKEWKLPSEIVSSIANSLTPLTGKLDTSLPAEQLSEVILCYYACRLADTLIFEQNGGTPEIQELSFESTGKLEFYYAKKLINFAKLDAINTAISATAFKRKVSELLSHLQV